MRAKRNITAARNCSTKPTSEIPWISAPSSGEAETYLAENQPDKALALMQTEVTSHPDRSDLPREYASLKTRAGQFDSAMADYQTLLNGSRTSPRTPPH